MCVECQAHTQPFDCPGCGTRIPSGSNPFAPSSCLRCKLEEMGGSVAAVYVAARRLTECRGERP